MNKSLIVISFFLIAFGITSSSPQIHIQETNDLHITTIELTNNGRFTKTPTTSTSGDCN